MQYSLLEMVLEVPLSPEEKPINAVARVAPLIFLAGMPGGNGTE